MGGLGMVYEKEGNVDAALNAYKHAIHLWRRLQSMGNNKEMFNRELLDTEEKCVTLCLANDRRQLQQSSSLKSCSQQNIEVSNKTTQETSLEPSPVDSQRAAVATATAALGVYCISSKEGALTHKSPNGSDAANIFGKIECGQYIEVLQVCGYGVATWARIKVPDVVASHQEKKHLSRDEKKESMKFMSVWICLLDTRTGLSGATPVPLGTYVIIADWPGCNITEGAQLDSKNESATLTPGSIMEVVATRMEKGMVLGLTASGGYVTLFHFTSKYGNSGTQIDSNNSLQQRNDDGNQIIITAIPIPLGIYQVIHGALTVTSDISSASSCQTKLALNTMVEIMETHVEKGSTDESRVRGRFRTTNADCGGVVHDASGNIDNGGWITMLEAHGPKMRMYVQPKQSK